MAFLIFSHEIGVLIEDEDENLDLFPGYCRSGTRRPWSRAGTAGWCSSRAPSSSRAASTCSEASSSCAAPPTSPSTRATTLTRLVRVPTVCVVCVCVVVVGKW